MNQRELTMLQRRIDRTRKLAVGMLHAAQRMNEELSMIEAFVRDAQQPPTDEVRPERKSRAKDKPVTEDDVIRIIEGIVNRRPNGRMPK